MYPPPRTRYLISCCFAVGPASAVLARQGNSICSRSRVFAGLPRSSGPFILGCLGTMARYRCSFGNADRFCTCAGLFKLSCLDWGFIGQSAVFELFEMLVALISSPNF